MYSYWASAHFCTLTSGSTDDQRGIRSSFRGAFQILLPDRDRSTDRASGFPVLGGARYRDVSAGLARLRHGDVHVPGLSGLSAVLQFAGYAAIPGLQLLLLHAGHVGRAGVQSRALQRAAGAATAVRLQRPVGGWRVLFRPDGQRLVLAGFGPDQAHRTADDR